MAHDTIDTLLADLTRERDALDAELQAMIAEMEATPVGQRRAGAWAADGASHRALSRIVRAAGRGRTGIIDLSRQRASSGPPPSVH